MAGARRTSPASVGATSMARIPQGSLPHQSRVRRGNQVRLLRAIVDERVDPPVVVTVYQTTRVSKYWREP